ncbi:hypothetical protein LDENG_00218310 [Lucifuga dentata]|nr:hypothetical protein LDENG_00218310 [Lucifuga dentata]
MAHWESDDKQRTAVMRPCLEQCLFLLNLERLSDAVLPPGFTRFSSSCFSRTSSFGEDAEKSRALQWFFFCQILKLSE